ncbi:MAG TPA: YbhB/YbcL family Raf kinase inhibitor-like protein [Cyclobacteriaceae bacterium]|nr:YbhB/YbcL family Raf kinase inhibitor-like protein [Cyclobacteriaceae bacterium]
MILKSKAFVEGGSIPTLYTCDGKDVSPPLSWEEVPGETRYLSLICEDPDAPAGLWIHWVIFNIPVSEPGLAENVPRMSSLKNGAVQGKNTARQIGYGGPCPPGGTHRYFFRLYALDAPLNLGPEARKDDVVKAIEGHITGTAVLMGIYSRG